MSLPPLTGSRATAARSVPKAARAETIRQAERWDQVKNQAVRFGLCDPCAAQYAWGAADGFTIVRPPCPKCSSIVAAAMGAVKPNGWRVLPGTPGSDTPKRSGGPHSRNTSPPIGRDGYGSCRGCGDSWSGFAVCHCTGCHCTFADIRAFDQHRTGSHDGTRGCADPGARGLVKVVRAHWTGWALRAVAGVFS